MGHKQAKRIRKLYRDTVTDAHTEFMQTVARAPLKDRIVFALRVVFRKF